MGLYRLTLGSHLMTVPSPLPLTVQLKVRLRALAWPPAVDYR